ncbi:MAG: SH3 domain-containing protein [Oscillospiraceae bacterium]|nr:SH3 domain-containing protein [Oscillospiraceae bacterium]
MKRTCKNCGAKLPRKSDICKKCGEEYEYISLDPETAKLIEVEKPSSMIHVCIMILASIIFIFSLLLIYLSLSGKNDTEKLSSAPVVQSSIPDTSSDSQVEEVSNYYAIDFIGQTLGEVKETIGEQYSIKLSDMTQIVYIDYPITLFTTDKTPTDDSVICKVIVTESGKVTSQISADNTYTELVSILNLAKPAPELNEEDSYYYAYRALANDNYQVKVSFKFGFDTTDQPPVEVILECEELTAAKLYGTVSGLDEGSSLNVRTEPLYAAEALTQIYENDVVEILEEYTSEDGVKWYKISVNDVTGYSVAEFIAIDNDSDENNTSDESSTENE